MKPIIRVALAAGAAMAALTPVLANHSWGNYHWARNGRELPLTINRAITSQWTASVGTAIADWEKSRKLALTARNAGAINRKACEPILGEVLVCNDGWGRRGWLGIATIYISGTHIIAGTTKLNDSYFDLPFYNTPAWRALVACQEIAHDFGLDHQDETFGNFNLGTCMDYTNAPSGGIFNGFNYGPSNEHPNKHDYDQIATIYSHDDGTAAAATNFGFREVGKPAAPTTGLASSGVSPAEWGRAIRTDREGRPNVFEKELGPGKKMITHVFWAIGEGPGRSN